MAKPASLQSHPKPNWQKRLVEFSRTLAYRSPVYSAMLNGEVPNHLSKIPRDALSGDANSGNAIMRGIFPLGGRHIPVEIKSGKFSIWDAKLSPLAYEELHSFRWLRHLHAIGGNAARHTARQWIEDWMARYNLWDERAWQPLLIGERLTGWFAQYAFFGNSADDMFRISFFQSVMRQLRHLVRCYDRDSFGRGRLSAVKGMLYAAFALGNDYLELSQVTAELQEMLSRDIMNDGCYYGRAPALQLSVLQDLIEIRSLFTFAQMPVPEGLADAITAMARGLRHLRHGDGGLANFHGSFEDSPDLIDVLMLSANVKGRAGESLDDGGWHRLNAGRALMIVDAGSVRCEKTHAHQSPLAMEFSVGRERIIVNCGSGLALDHHWIEACQNINAHSALSIEGCDPQPHYFFNAERKISEGSLWFSASHDAYRHCGITHTRNIYMNPTGDDIRGEDILSRATDGNPSFPFTIRFHLHPKIQSIAAQNSAIIKTASGGGWRLRTSGGNLTLEDSVYLGQKGQLQKTKQIVIRGELLTDNAQIKWALQKEGKK